MMKKSFYYLLLITSSILTFNCSSDDGDDNQSSEYYFTFKADGQRVSYNLESPTHFNLNGSYMHDAVNNLYTINTAGMVDMYDTSYRNRLIILMSDTSEFYSNTNYSNIEATGVVVPDFTFSVIYYDNNGTLYMAALNTIPGVPLYENAYVSFNEINDDNLKGTFSGTLYNYDASSGTNVLSSEIEITEGEFNVPRL